LIVVSLGSTSIGTFLDSVSLGKNKLCFQEIMNTFDLSFFQLALLVGAKFLREHDMVSEGFISYRLSNLITFKLIFLFGKYVIHHELMPVLLPFVEQNSVTKMK
jgi:hypothetical protein